MKKILVGCAFLLAAWTAEAQTIIVQTSLDNTAGAGKLKQWFWQFVIHDGDNEPKVEGHYKYTEPTERVRLMKDLTMVLNRYYDQGYKLRASTENVYILQVD